MSLSFLNFLRSGESVPRLSAAEYLSRREEDAVVLDVRSEAEYRSGHVKGAQRIDLMDPDFTERIEALDRDRSYYLYCRSGNRSGHAGTIMKRLGFERVYNIGGLAELARGGVETSR